MWKTKPLFCWEKIDGEIGNTVHGLIEWNRVVSTSTFPLYFSPIFYSCVQLSPVFFSISLQPSTYNFHLISRLIPFTFSIFAGFIYLFILYQTNPKWRTQEFSYSMFHGTPLTEQAIWMLTRLYIEILEQ